MDGLLERQIRAGNRNYDSDSQRYFVRDCF